MTNCGCRECLWGGRCQSLTDGEADALTGTDDPKRGKLWRRDGLTGIWTDITPPESKPSGDAPSAARWRHPWEG